MPADALDVSLVERALALRAFPAFEQLPPAEIAVIAEHVRPRWYRRGSVVLQRGQRARALHFVIHGRLEQLGADGSRVSVGLHQVAGGLSALIDEPQVRQVVAAEDSVTLHLNRDDMMEVFEDNFPIFLGVLRVMARTLMRARQTGSQTNGQRRPSDRPPPEASELGLVERILFLRRALSFARTEIEALAELAEQAEELALEPESCLWAEGDGSEHAVVVISGRVECLSSGGQRFELGADAMVGGMAALAGEPRWYAAHALTPVRGLAIPTRTLLDVIEDNMNVGMNLLQTIAREIREVTA